MGTLSPAEVEQALGDLAGWAVDGDTIIRTVRRSDFRAAIALVDRIADAAEAANHHPDLCVRGYRTVEVRLTTHSEGGITERDLAMARTIEGLVGS
ncbi:MAG TPA: 4a-hydroxytetrahydrobiopterin dehydratase [Candidatus Limnocylindrales bacterium]